ncbi:universal stress protein [Actinoplanes sp. N902-109]|uniref:universal stress protein n=1 Tax=Actinoplanes sp. (strain N902-109) TaxID=649831 RepID=UPI0003295F74|nr:universal stress protein [Actinoplanes sp. N902-109]AGL16963.1 UspA domain-containing protein [Actinoplanes sp. N902-109]
MSHLDSHRLQRDPPRAGGTAAATRYSDMINRYLAIGHYRSEEAVRPAPRVPPVAVGTVLAAVDDSPVSCTAVDHAAIEAQLHGWYLRLVHVHRGGSPVAREEGARLLERLTDRVHAGAPSVAVTSRLIAGAAAPLLLTNARDTNLVVVGHRHATASCAFGRTVGDRVAAYHSGVVMVVRMPGWPPGPEFGARPIVVGVDAAGTRTRAVDFALREAAFRGCDLVMAHAGRNATPAERAERNGEVLVHHRVVAADPVTALLEFSGRAAAVVVGRQAPGAPPGRLLGSVSRAMVQRARCPVFLAG